MSNYSTAEVKPTGILSGTNQNPILTTDNTAGFRVIHHDAYVVKNNTQMVESSSEINLVDETEIDEVVDMHLMHSNYASLRSS